MNESIQKILKENITSKVEVCSNVGYPISIYGETDSRLYAQANGRTQEEAINVGNLFAHTMNLFPDMLEILTKIKDWELENTLLPFEIYNELVSVLDKASNINSK